MTDTVKGRRRWRMLVAAGTALLAGASWWSALAVEVTPDQAQTAARNWVTRNPRPMSASFASSEPVRHRAYRNAAGNTIYHVVDMDGGGFVVTSADTTQTPIVGFSGSGTFDDDDRNPLKALLGGDLDPAAGIPLAFASAAARPSAPTGAASTAPGGERSAAEQEWDSLLVEDFIPPVMSVQSQSSLDDVRVAPLVLSKWSQSTWGDRTSTRVYNYYTPNYYVCGCVATAFAQIMRKWSYPTGSVSAGSYDCYVDGTAVKKTMKGGTYDWSSMPLSYESTPNISERQCQAIGKLTYDVGVTAQMDWGRDGSGTWGPVAASALRNRFGYASVNSMYTGAADFQLKSATENAIFSSLDAGMPVVIGIHGKKSNGDAAGHEVVVDGYGYKSGTRYAHLNAGWSGSSDFWYNLMGEALLDNVYTKLSEVSFNIHPTIAGDTISGRVLNSSGAAVSGATVTLEDASGSRKTATTNAKGIYYFRVQTAGTYQLSATSGSQSSISVSETIARSVNTDVWVESGAARYNTRGSCGSVWGCDLTLSAASADRPDLHFSTPSLTPAWPVPIFLTATENSVTPRTSFNVGDKIYLSVSFGNQGTATVSSPFKVLHEVLSGSTVVKSKVLELSTDYEIRKGTCRYWDCRYWPDLFGGLSAGSYTYRVKLDSGSNIAETDESNNVATYSFTVAGQSIPLSEAVDSSSLTFTTGGSASWFGQSSVSHSGGDAAQSGMIANSQSSWMQTTVSGSGTLGFWWKTSSEERYDKLLLYVDGVNVANISGATDWTFVSHAVTGTGSHTVKWSYEKDASGLGGSDCGWVDGVTWSASSQTTAFNANGGSCATTSRIYTPGSAHSWLPRPVARSGYLFTGWFTSASGGAKVDVDSTVPTANRTLYAQWASSSVVLAGALKAADSDALTFTTGGDASWFAHRCQTYDGVAAGWSGIVDANQSSWVQTTVTGPGELSFRWAVSSESGYDKLRLLIDGVEARILSGSSGWNLVSTDISAGAHAVRWVYEKDLTRNVGWDCGFLDEVKWRASNVTVTFDPNGGTVSEPSRVYSRGATYGTLPTPTYGLKTFDGWFTARTGGTKVTSSNVVPNASTTLYAQWKDPVLPQPGPFLNQALAFTTSTDAPWFGQYAVSHDADGAAQSGAITHGGASWMQTTVSGEGEFSFWYKVSTEAGYDKLIVIVDGTAVTNFSGEVGWTRFRTTITGSGDHVIRWMYSKDTSGSHGADACWIDGVEWGAACTLHFTSSGGTQTSTSVTLSESVVLDASTKPEWVSLTTKSPTYSDATLGAARVMLLSGEFRFLVECQPNAGSERSWTMELAKTSGEVVYTLTIVQEAAAGFPNLGFIPASQWPAAHYMSAEQESYEACGEFEEGDAVYFNVSYWNNGGAMIDTPFVIRHEVLDCDGNVLATWNYSQGNQMPASTTQCRCWFGCAWSSLQELPPGDYVHRCTLDATSVIREADETDNVSECAFTVHGAEMTVAFDPNGGTVSPASRTYVSGESYGSLPVPRRSGYAFEGWYTAAEGGERVTESSIVSSDVVRLYAHWSVLGRPDLRVSAFASSARSVEPGIPVTLTFAVENGGDGIANATRAQVLNADAGSSLGYVATPELSPGASASLTFVVTPSATARYAVVADVDDSADESDETNNRSQTLTVEVEDQRPWSFDDVSSDPRSFPTVFEEVVVNFNGALAPEGSQVAAFLADSESIYGLGSVGADGQTTFYVMVGAGRKVHFRLWNSEDGEIYELPKSSDVTVESPGDLLTNLTLDFTDQVFERLDISFAEAGWHLMSFNVLPADASPNRVMAPVLDKVDYVISDAALWNPRSGGNLACFEIGRGYWVHTTGADVRWSVEGEGDASKSLTLIEGWNIVGYTLPSGGQARDVLATAYAEGKIRYVCTTEAVALFPLQDLSMTPGYGYWVYANEDCSIAYDGVGPGFSPASFAGDADRNPWSETKIKVDDRVFPTVLEDVAVTLNGVPAQKGDVLALVRDDTGDVCAVSSVGDGGLVTLHIMAVKDRNMHFEFWPSSSGLETPTVIRGGAFVSPEPGDLVTGLRVDLSSATASEITFDANGGLGAASPVTATNGAAMPPVTVAPTRSGYAFAGYFDAVEGGVQYYTDALESARNWDKTVETATLYAHWVVREYQIAYAEIREGAVNPNPATYTIEDEILFAPLNDSAVVGWDFVGWTPASIAKGSTGDVTVSASWVLKTFTNNVDGVPVQVKYGDDVLLNAPFDIMEEGGAQVVCVGWTGTGDVTDGTGTQCVFTVTQASALSWVYRTNYWFEATASGGGLVTVRDSGFAADPAGSWVPDGLSVVVEATGDMDRFLCWQDLLSGAQLADSAELTVVMDAPRLIEAVFSDDVSTLALSVTGAGWHEMSFGVLPEGGKPEDVFAAVEDKVGYVTYGSLNWNPLTGGTLLSLEIGKGYWVQTTAESVSWTVTGQPNPDVGIALKPGWNLIGYPLLEEGEIETVLATALSTGNIRYIYSGSRVYPGMLTTMTPGKGYWVYAEAAATIRFDAK